MAIGIFGQAVADRRAREKEEERYQQMMKDQAAANIPMDPAKKAEYEQLIRALGGDPNKKSAPDPTSHKMSWPEYRKFKMQSEGVDVGPDPREAVRSPPSGRTPASAFGSLDDTWEESLKKTLTEPGRYQKEIKETVMPPDYNWPGDNVYPGRTPDEIDLLEQEQIKKWGSPDRGPEPMPERHLASDDLQVAPDYPMLKAQGEANSAQADVFKKMMGGKKDWKREVPYGPGADPMGQSNDWDSRIQMNQFRNAAAEDEMTNLRQVGRGMGANMGSRGPGSLDMASQNSIYDQQYIDKMKAEGRSPEEIQAFIEGQKQLTPLGKRRLGMKQRAKSRLKSQM